MTDPHDITAKNLEAWEEAAPIHARHNQARLLEFFAAPGASTLNEVEAARLREIGVEGKAVAQVCCNNGRELISIKNMGAGGCVGFDGAQGFIEQGREIAAAAGQDVELVATDIYDIDASYDGAFDLVVITIGVISWMPDLDRFFAVLARLLRPGGTLFIYESHPIVEIMEPGPAGGPIVYELPYFESEPFVETTGLDYWGGEAYDAKPATSFIRPLSTIIMAGIDAGLTLTRIEERPEHISNTWYNIEAADMVIPMSYVMEYEKR